MKKLFSLLLLLIFIGCSEDDSSSQEPPQVDIEIQENVVVINEDSQLISNNSQLEEGLYIFEFTENIQQIIEGDVIVGQQGSGYLRNVEEVTIDGNIVTLKTTQATMEDVFLNANFNMDSNITQRSSGPIDEEIKVRYLAEGVAISNNGLVFDFSDTVIYEDGPAQFKITDGTATFDPNFEIDFDFKSGKLEEFEFKTENTSLTLDCNLFLGLTAGANLLEASKTLAEYDKTFVRFVGLVPVVVVVSTALEAKLSLDVGAEIGFESGFTNTNTLSLGASYANGVWTGINETESSVLGKPLTRTGEVTLSQNLTITPEVSIKFYGIVGPYCQPIMTEDLQFSVETTTLDWNAELKAGLNIVVGADATVLGETLADFNTSLWNSQETVWNAPNKLEIISGNEQTGNQGSPLAEPIKIKVTDALDNALSNVPVYFDVAQNDGSVDNQSLLTDDNGFAEVIWTLGTVNTNQVLNVDVRNSDGSSIENAPIMVNATAEDSSLIIGTWVANSVLFNGQEIFNSDCYERLVFSTTKFNSQDFGVCNEPQATGGNYSISGNTLIVNFTEGDFTGSNSQQILELTDTNFVVSEGSGYVYSYERVDVSNYEQLIIGTWRANSVLYNGEEIFNPECYEDLVYTSSNFTAQDYGPCDNLQSTGGDYSINVSTLNLNFTEGDFSGNLSLPIWNLTTTSLVLGEDSEYVYSYQRL